MVYYQPKIDCIERRIRGVEALVRWNHPRHGFIPAETFLRVAEETGMIGDIDRLVIAEALAEIGSLIDAGADLILAVNVTPGELADPEFVKDIVRLVHHRHFPPTRLEVEITESLAMRDPDSVVDRVSTLRQLGIRLAIDDFGTGYSNLATLARLPFDTLKIDRSLVTGVAQDTQKQSIIRIALGLARELGFDTVAEGVESPEDFKFLADEGTTMAQGYVFSPAVPIGELSAMIASNYLSVNPANPLTAPPAFSDNVVSFPSESVQTNSG